MQNFGRENKVHLGVCIKKRDARAELFFVYIINCILTLSLLSPWWLLQPPVVILYVELVLAFILYVHALENRGF